MSSSTRTRVVVALVAVLLAVAAPARATIVVPIQPGPVEGKDTRAHDYTWAATGTDNDNRNFGGDSLMWAGTNGWRGGYNNHTFIQFDLSAIPTGDHIGIVKADLDLYLFFMEHHYRADTLQVRRLTQAWTEGSGGIIPDPGPYDPNTPVTWNNRPADDGVNWASTYVPAPGTQPPTHAEVNEWINFDVTGLVSAWHDGTHPNYGMLVRAAGTGGPTYRFRTSDYGDAELWPVLTIEYVPEPATLSLLALGGLGILARRRRQR